jgi:hypothetical protein
MCVPLSGGGHQRVLRDRAPVRGLHGDDGGDELAEARVGDADGGDFEDALVRVERVLDGDGVLWEWGLLG